MSIQPFSVSMEAAAWIVETLERGAEALEIKAGGASLVPILCFAYTYQKFDREYADLLERYDQDHFFLGWNSINEIDSGDFLPIEIGGHNIFVQHSILKMLEGKELILEMSEVGFPISGSEQRQLLKARTNKK